MKLRLLLARGTFLLENSHLGVDVTDILVSPPDKPTTMRGLYKEVWNRITLVLFDSFFLFGWDKKNNPKNHSQQKGRLGRFLQISGERDQCYGESFAFRRQCQQLGAICPGLGLVLLLFSLRLGRPPSHWRLDSTCEFLSLQGLTGMYPTSIRWYLKHLVRRNRRKLDDWFDTSAINMVISRCYFFDPNHPRCFQALASYAPDMGLSPDDASLLRVGHWLGRMLYLPSLKLTVRTRKWMLGILVSFYGMFPWPDACFPVCWLCLR